MPSPTTDKKTQSAPANTQAKPASHVRPASQSKPAPPAGEKPVEEKKAIDWEAFGAVTVDSGDAAAGDRVDVEKEVPKVIRDEVELSLSKYLEKVKAKPEGDRKTKLKSGGEKAYWEPHWLLKKLPNADLAKEYVRLIRRYGKYRPAGQITVRGGQLKKDPTTVRFCAKTYEERTKETGSETKADSK